MHTAFFVCVCVQDKNVCDLGSKKKKVQDQIPLHKSASEKLNKNPFLQIKTAAFLLPFKHLNTLFTWCLSFQVKVTRCFSQAWVWERDPNQDNNKMTQRLTSLCLLDEVKTAEI